MKKLREALRGAFSARQNTETSKDSSLVVISGKVTDIIKDPETGLSRMTIQVQKKGLKAGTEYVHGYSSLSVEQLRALYMNEEWSSVPLCLVPKK